jgi:hypothetical protein
LAAAILILDFPVILVLVIGQKMRFLPDEATLQRHHKVSSLRLAMLDLAIIRIAVLAAAILKVKEAA